MTQSLTQRKNSYFLEHENPFYFTLYTPDRTRAKKNDQPAKKKKLMIKKNEIKFSVNEGKKIDRLMIKRESANMKILLPDYRKLKINS